MSGGLTRICWQLANAARNNNKQRCWLHGTCCWWAAAGAAQPAATCLHSISANLLLLERVAAAASYPPAGIDSMRHNYLLLGLAIFQFPLNAWLARLPPLPAAAAATVKAAVNQATEPLML